MYFIITLTTKFLVKSVPVNFKEKISINATWLGHNEHFGIIFDHLFKLTIHTMYVVYSIILYTTDGIVSLTEKIHYPFKVFIISISFYITPTYTNINKSFDLSFCPICCSVMKYHLFSMTCKSLNLLSFCPVSVFGLKRLSLSCFY